MTRYSVSSCKTGVWAALYQQRLHVASGTGHGEPPLAVLCLVELWLLRDLPDKLIRHIFGEVSVPLAVKQFWKDPADPSCLYLHRGLFAMAALAIVLMIEKMQEGRPHVLLLERPDDLG